MKTIPKLKDIYQDEEFTREMGLVGFSRNNVDDIFHFLKVKNIDEVEVDWGEMLTIVLFVLTNVSDKTLKILKEGKIDKFLGVKLKLYE